MRSNVLWNINFPSRRQKDKKMFGSNKSISDFYHPQSLSDAGNNLHQPLASTETQACEFSVNTFPLEKT